MYSLEYPIEYVFITSIPQMEKLSLRKIKQPAWGCTATKGAEVKPET